MFRRVYTVCIHSEAPNQLQKGKSCTDIIQTNNTYIYTHIQTFGYVIILYIYVIHIYIYIHMLCIYQNMFKICIMFFDIVWIWYIRHFINVGSGLPCNQTYYISRTICTRPFRQRGCIRIILRCSLKYDINTDIDRKRETASTFLLFEIL